MDAPTADPVTTETTAPWDQLPRAAAPLAVRPAAALVTPADDLAEFLAAAGVSVRYMRGMVGSVMTDDCTDTIRNRLELYRKRGAVQLGDVSAAARKVATPAVLSRLAWPSDVAREFETALLNAVKERRAREEAAERRRIDEEAERLRSDPTERAKIDAALAQLRGMFRMPDEPTRGPTSGESQTRPEEAGPQSQGREAAEGRAGDQANQGRREEGGRGEGQEEGDRQEGGGRRSPAKAAGKNRRGKAGRPAK